jgi:DNA modification methylase
MRKQINPQHLSWNALRSPDLPQAVRLQIAFLLVSARAGLPAGQDQSSTAGASHPDVIDMPYSGNKLHPTQKPLAALKPLIEAFSQKQELVLDPFCGSGSTLSVSIDSRR